MQDETGIHFFRRNGGSKWVQFDTIIGGRICSVADHTFATDMWDSSILHIDEYDESLNETVPVQELPTSYWVNSISLSANFLAFRSSGGYVSIYHREEVGQPFTLHQPDLFYIDPGISERPLALDEDVLMISGSNDTHIFTEQDGSWEEAITLGQPYGSYQVSGRTVLAVTDENEVYSL